jgi:hypothetical protein
MLLISRQIGKVPPSTNFGGLGVYRDLEQFSRAMGQKVWDMRSLAPQLRQMWK